MFYFCKRVSLLFMAVCALVACGDKAAAPSEGEQIVEENALPNPISDDEKAFVVGNIAFTLFHEQGHALVSELDLPVLGREEDAVDRMATLFLVADEDTDDVELLTDAMLGWFLSSEQENYNDIAWWGEHSSDEQRAYQIACLLYGSDPDGYRDVANDVELPDERRESCIDEYENSERDIARLLEPHMLGIKEKPSAAVTIEYQSTSTYRSELELLKDSGLMQWVAEDLQNSFRLQRPLTVKAKTCNESNAYWDSEAAEMVLCYELIRDFRHLYHDQSVTD